MRNTLLALASFLFLVCPSAQAQNVLATVRQTTMVGDDKPTLNSEKKDKLAYSIAGTSFVGSVFLSPMTMVKVISQNGYETKETVGPTAQRIKRTFKVALVEVQDGPNKGKKGWVVTSWQDEGQAPEVYLMAPPAQK